jgi:hypothetical protein
MNWLEQIAPTIATCLGGPLAGLAVTALSKLFGVAPDEVKNMIEDGKLSAEQIEAVKVEEIRFKEQTQALGLNFEQLAVEDRKSARSMQSETKSTVPAILSYAITVGFFGILFSIMTGYAQDNNQPLLIMLGALGTAWISVISFWFGSTNASHVKDDMLYHSTPTKQ